MDIELTKFDNRLVINENGIEKYIRDPLKYETIEFSNRLRVMYVEDKNSYSSSACMTVSVGSDHDPERFLGLAHLLEHMLFMGSARYPKESMFHEFVSHNGGSHNAFTANDHTCFHFKIPSFLFYETLDMFSDFFTDPLLATNSVEREVKAVNSEHQKNINQDIWRFMGMTKYFYIKGHPGKKFATGNLSTLLRNTNSEGVKELREALVNFYNTHYSSHIMTLFIYHNNVDSDLKKIVLNNFGKIKLRFIQPLYYPDRILLNNQPLQKLEFVSVDDRYVLSLIWEAPKYIGEYDIAVEILNSLLKRKGIYDELCRRKYLIDISFQPFLVHGQKQLYVIRLELTELGYNSLIDVIKLVYRYIETVAVLLKDPATIKNLYDEKRASAIISFVDYNKIDCEDFVVGFAQTVQSGVSINRIMTRSLYSDDLHSVNRRLVGLLDLIRPENSVVILSSRSVDPTDTLIDPYYDTPYKLGTITCELNLDDCSFNTLQRNRYLCNRLHLPDTKEEIHKTPSKLDVNSNNVYYYDSINVFGSPNSVVYIDLHHTSYDKVAFLYFYVELVRELFEDKLHDVENAQYQLQIDTDDSTISFFIAGPRENFMNVVSTAFDMLFFYEAPLLVPVNIFEKVHNKLVQNLSNFKNKPPYERLEDVMQSRLFRVYTPIKTLLASIEKMTYDMLNVIIKNVKEIIESTNISCVFGGDIQPESINHIVSILEDKVKLTKDRPERLLKDVWKDGQVEPIFIECNDNNDPNAAMRYYVKLDTIVERLQDSENWAKKLCCASLLNGVINTIYFDIVRTKMQLGYIVGANTTVPNKDNRCKEIYMMFVVQSPTHNVNYIKNKTDDVIKRIHSRLNKLPQDVFDNMKTGLRSRLQEKDKNVYERLQRYRKIINCTGQPIFERNTVLLNALDQIDRQYFINYYIERFIKNKRVFVVGISACIKKMPTVHYF